MIVRPESSFTSRWRPCFLCLGNRFRATWRLPPGQRSQFHVSWVVFAASVFLGQAHSHSSLFGGSRSGELDFVTRMPGDTIMLLFIFALLFFRKNMEKETMLQKVDSVSRCLPQLTMSKTTCSSTGWPSSPHLVVRVYWSTPVFGVRGFLARVSPPKATDISARTW